MRCTVILHCLTQCLRNAWMSCTCEGPNTAEEVGAEVELGSCSKVHFDAVRTGRKASLDQEEARRSAPVRIKAQVWHGVAAGRCQRDVDGRERRQAARAEGLVEVPLADRQRRAVLRQMQGSPSVNNRAGPGLRVEAAH